METIRPTPHLSLRRVVSDDATYYHALQCDLRSEPELGEFLSFRQLNTPAQYEQGLRKLQGKDECPFLITRRDNESPAGICGFRWNEFVDAAEIYVWLDRRSRGKHYGTEACEALIDLAFRLDWPLVVAVPHPKNRRSIDLLSAINMPHFACILHLDRCDMLPSTHTFPVYCRHRDSDLDLFNTTNAR